MRPWIWSEDVNEWASQHVSPWHAKPADLLTWGLLCGGSLTAAVIVALVLRVWR